MFVVMWTIRVRVAKGAMYAGPRLMNRDSRGSCPSVGEAASMAAGYSSDRTPPFHDVAANYAATRSAMVKAIGLGQLRGSAGARKRGRPPKAIQN